MVAENGLTELTVEAAGVQITVKAEPETVPVPVVLAPQEQPFLVAPGTPPTALVAAPLPPSRAATTVALESPMVGVFYRSAAPEDPPFISVGDIIRVGQPIGLIEAMKVYSEVPAEAAGRVVDIPVDNGKLVQHGQPLVIIEPL